MESQKLHRPITYKYKNTDGVIKLTYLNSYLKQKANHQVNFNRVLENLKKI